MIPERDFVLLVDIGNTFLKWGLFRPSHHGTARDNRVESAQSNTPVTPRRRKIAARQIVPGCSVLSALDRSSHPC